MPPCSSATFAGAKSRSKSYSRPAVKQRVNRIAVDVQEPQQNEIHEGVLKVGAISR